MSAVNLLEAVRFFIRDLLHVNQKYYHYLAEGLTVIPIVATDTTKVSSHSLSFSDYYTALNLAPHPNELIRL